MGYEDMNTYPFVLRSYENEESGKKAYEVAENYDVVIFGASPVKFLQKRMQDNKLTFRFCERSLKKGTWRRFIPRTRKKIYEGYTRYKNDKLYVLGASAYASYDLSLCGFQEDKCLRWGYFPRIKQNDIDALMVGKKNNAKVEILYAGRLLKLKKVMDTVQAVRCLIKKNIFNLQFTIIGDGPEKAKIEQYIQKHRLEKYIKILPFMKPEEVRIYMDKADIYVFGSNYYEGWGAVMNEAMNSACAMLVSHAVGSAAYLIEQDKNGFIYPCGNIKRLTELLRLLIMNPEKREQIGRKAYETITQTWTAEVAAERFLQLCEAIENDRDYKNLFKDGPCSLAGVLKKALKEV
ncbi:MAG: glycosyltransferase family 4 protein [Clostridia bacterium]|nr:glycosyltransferase family 4 protein [Clostridia bacterium]